MSDFMSLHANLFPSIGFIQFQITPADPKKNIHRVTTELSKVQPDLHSLVILPELWATGYAFRKMDILADQTEEILDRLSEIARQYSITFGGSLPEKVVEDGHYCLYNTFYFIGGGHIFGKIRKQYLFASTQEDMWFSAGGYQKAVTTPFGMIGGCICSDIRFPHVAHQFCQQGAQIFTVAAQWPESRIDHWCVLLKARAIENQTFLVACNGLGSCNGIQLGGNSLIIDPSGKVLINAKNREGAFFVPVNWKIQDEVRKNFNTVAPQRGPVDYCEKIADPEECIQLITRRTLFGQRVICVRLLRENLDVGLINFLQKNRKSCDYLVVVPETARLQEEDVAHSEAASKPPLDLSLLAALDCVDIVVDGAAECLAALENTVERVVLWK